MREEGYLRRLVAEHGFFLRREAEALGYDDRTIQLRMRSNIWTKVRHGTYTFTDVWNTLGEHERFLVHGQAVLRTHDERGVLSHASSIARHGIDYWGVDLSETHVTRYDGSLGRSSRDVRYHAGAIAEGDIQRVDGYPVTSPERAVIELALVSSVESGLVSANSALQRSLVTPDDLLRARSHLEAWPGALTARLVVRLADGRCESVGESRAMYLMWTQGIPKPELQYEVRDRHGNLAGVTDFAWPEYGLMGEFDGRVKYGRLLLPGETPGDAVFREKQREDLLRELTGWRMIRIIWAELYTPVATADRIRVMLRLSAGGVAG